MTEAIHIDLQPVLYLPTKIPAPSHRHAAPSGPWPFLDISARVDTHQLDHLEASTPPCDHQDPLKCRGCWTGYPQSLFPNWTPYQQKRSRISKLIEQKHRTCILHYVDMDEDGTFVATKDLTINDSNKHNHWELMRAERPPGTRLRSLFVESLNGPMLQMLGTKYIVEPFYFSSALSWIPSRYQENIQPGKGDHITITLNFIRPIANSTTVLTTSTISTATTVDDIPEDDLIIDTQAPLSIESSESILVPDLLALHLVRSNESNTLISYHPGPEYRTTSSRDLHARLIAAGRSVYWNKIFTSSPDPTFVFLALLWYALYSWDEAFETLYQHICSLESEVLKTNDIRRTHELHALRAHLLHYASLLEDFRKTVQFVLDSPNPALDDRTLYSVAETQFSRALMEKECKNLLNQIERLERSRSMQEKRLKNVMDLGFSKVNIDDSHQMRRMTEATLRDSAAMKQIAYLTMVFLPGSFTAAVFGMNVKEINDSAKPLSHYVIAAILLTILTTWVIVAIQIPPGWQGLGKASRDQQANVPKIKVMFRRLCWPFILIYSVFEWTGNYQRNYGT